MPSLLQHNVDAATPTPIAKPETYWLAPGGGSMRRDTAEAGAGGASLRLATVRSW